MRREIKFRAWDDQNKFWVDRCIIENDGEVAFNPIILKKYPSRTYSDVWYIADKEHDIYSIKNQSIILSLNE